MKIKKLISAIVALAMSASLITAMPTSVSAETKTEISKYTFESTSSEVYSNDFTSASYDFSTTPSEMTLQNATVSDGIMTVNAGGWDRKGAKFAPSLESGKKYMITWDVSSLNTGGSGTYQYLVDINSGDTKLVDYPICYQDNGVVNNNNGYNFPVNSGKDKVIIDTDSGKYETYFSGNQVGSGTLSTTENFTLNFWSLGSGYKIDNIVVTDVTGWTMKSSAYVSADGQLKAAGGGWNSDASYDTSYNLGTLEQNTIYEISWNGRSGGEWTGIELVNEGTYSTAFFMSQTATYVNGVSTTQESGAMVPVVITLNTSTGAWTATVNGIPVSYSDNSVYTGSTTPSNAYQLNFHTTGNNFTYDIDDFKIMKAGVEDVSKWSLSGAVAENGKLTINGNGTAKLDLSDLEADTIYEITYDWDGTAAGTNWMGFGIVNGESNPGTIYHQKGYLYYNNNTVGAPEASTDKIVLNTSTGEWTVYVGEEEILTSTATSTTDYKLAFNAWADCTHYIDNVTITKVIPDEPIVGNVVTGGEQYIEFPAETVVTEGKWTGSFDFMTDVADSANIAWRNTFMMGANNAGGTKVIGAWVYNEGANVHVKAGDWDGSYQGGLSKNTWYTCKVTIDYDDTTSGSNARWYIIERDTNTQKAEYWANITSSIDRLLYQDERNSGKCYIDNVEVSVEAPEAPEEPAPYEDQEYTFDDATLPSGWAAGTGDGYSITGGQLVLAGTPNWGVDVTFDPNLRESGKYIIGWDYTTQATSFGDYGLFLKLLDSADMSQVKEVFSHMGDGQIHLGNNVFWNITTPTSRMEIEVDVDTKEWQLYVDGVAVTNAGGSGVGTWTESLAIGFMNYQHGTCKIDNVTVTKVVEEDLGAYQDQEYTFDEATLPSGWAEGTGAGYSITEGQLVLNGGQSWNNNVTFDPNLREAGKYKIGFDYTTQGTSFGDYGLFFKLLDSADMSQVKEVFSHMGDGQIHLGDQVFWNITLPTSRIEIEVDVDTKEWQLYVDGVAVTNAGGSGVGTWTESLAIGFMNYQHGTCKIDNVTVTKVVEQEPDIPSAVIHENTFDDGTKTGWSTGDIVDNALKITNYTDATLALGTHSGGVLISSVDFSIKDITADAAPRFRLAWTGPGGIDSGDRTGYWVNVTGSNFTLQNTSDWVESNELPLSGEYTLTAELDLDNNTSKIKVTNKGESTVLASFTGGFACDLTAFKAFSHSDNGYILLDNFVLRYEEKTPAIKAVTYSSNDADVTLVTSSVAAVEPDVKGISVELTVIPSEYNVEEYIKLTDASDAEMTYSFEVVGNTIVITPDENALVAGDTYKLAISKDLYAANGCQLGYDAAYSFKANEGSIKAKLISVTDGNDEELTTADEFLAAASFKINYKITNTSGDACEIAILRVYYDAEGYAVKTVPEYLTFTADQTSITDAVAANKDAVTGAETVSIFLWNDFDKYVPLCENILLP